MQFRIAARQPAAVGAVRRRFVGERRERQDFGAGIAPRREDMRIDEAERLIVRQRNPLPGRRDGGVICRGIDRQRRGACHDAVEIEMTFGHRGKPLDQRRQIGMFAGLHETEMAFGQRQRRLARHGAEDWNAERGDSVGDDSAMAFAGDAIEDHAGDAHGRIVGGKTPHHGRRRLRLPRHIEHEQHRQLEMRGEIGGRAALPSRRRWCRRTAP